MKYYDLTPSQLGIYLECSKHPESTAYNLPLYYTLGKEIDRGRLQTAVETALRRHGVFRSHVEYGPEGPCLVEGEEPIALRTLSCADGELDALRRSLVSPFDLEKGPLCRAFLIETESVYCVMLDVHHLSGDGATFGILSREIEAAYSGEALPEEGCSMFDVCELEQQKKDSEDRAKAHEYYKNILSGADFGGSPVEDLLPDGKGQPCGRFDLYADLDPEAIRALGVSEGVFFITAYAYAAAKFSGQTSALICTVNHGRNDPRLTNTAGMLVRTLPLYLSFQEEGTVREALTAGREALYGAIKNGEYPFGELAAEFQLDPACYIAYQGSSFNSLTLAGHKCFVERVPVQDAISKLNVMVFKEDQRFKVSFEYRSDLFREETVRSFADMYFTILSEFLTRERLRDVALASEGQLEALAALNQTGAPVEPTTCNKLFEEQVKLHPDKTAVIAGGESLTYRELNESANRIAHGLMEAGVGPDVMAGVMMPRTVYAYAAREGVMKAGGAFLPLAPDYPDERVAYILENSKAPAVVTTGELAAARGELFAKCGVRLLVLEELLRTPDASDPEPDVKPENLCYCIYTSGSTGRPKGVMIEHHSLVNFVNHNQYNWVARQFCENMTVTLALAAFTFDVSVLEETMPLYHGATVAIATEEEIYDPLGLAEMLRRNKVDVMKCTPSYMQSILDIPEVQAVLRQMKVLNIGAEPFPAPLLGKLRAAGITAKIYNSYGPTECTVTTAIGELAEGEPIHIGTPIGNAGAYILDPCRRILPVGAVGELAILGEGVGRGYVGNEALTKEKFITFQGRSAYLSGDMACWTSAGKLRVMGRMDNQVKLNGLRIELDEIENVMNSFPPVHRSVVQIRGGILCGWFTASEPVDTEALRAHVGRFLAPYMVPGALMQLDAFPMNQNGKVDKKALPDPDSGAGKEEEAPRSLNRLERELKAAVAGIIGREDFGPETDLLQLGLSSLSVIRLAVALKKAYGFEADVKKLLAGCTILSLEEDILSFLLEGDRSPAAGPAPAKPAKTSYPLNAAQFGVYADCMRNPGSVAYHIPKVFHFPVDTDPEKLSSAVSDVLRVHPALFTHLTLEGADVAQAYVDRPEPSVPVSAMTEAEYEAVRDSFIQPFNLMRGPLYHAMVVKTEVSVHLLCDFHHIVFDGESLDLFMKQLKAACEGVSPEKEEMSFFDYADWEAGEKGGEAYQQAEEFFAGMLRDCEAPSELTGDLGSAPTGVPAEAEVPIAFDQAEAFCRANGMTPAHLYLAASLYAVSRFTGNRGAYISTISSGRRDLKTAGCVGMFVKTLAVGAEVEDLPALDFVRKAAEVFNGAMDHELYPYSELCRKFSYAPHVMFEYQLGVLEALTVNGQPVAVETLGAGEAKFKVAINIALRDGAPAVVVRYDAGLYSAGLMAALASAVETATQAMIHSPEAPVRKVSLLTEAQRAELDRFAVTKEAPPAYHLMQASFEEQAAAHPERTALIATDRTLTYGELDRLGNRVANALLERGLTGGDRVVLLLRRTSKVFAAILGVLKAGGAYIPTNPDYPKERIETIQSDSQARFLITEADLLEAYPQGVAIDELLSGTNDAHPHVDISPEDLCYLIYTSGSTGKPKGVMIRHRSIANYIQNDPVNLHIHYPVQYGSRYGSVTTLAFDMALKEVWGSLSNGMTLVFAGDGMTTDPEALGRFFLENQVDVFNATPSRLLEYMEAEPFARAMANCKVILSGGEGYPDVLLKRLREQTKAHILNTYGPTEITVSSNVGDLTQAGYVSVGRPLLNYREAIVDMDGNRLPVGVVGELLISGIGVGAGYNNLPEQTEKAFITYEGLPTYRSGDYARWTEEGSVVILGRKDNQVKIRGLRIELGEIERVLTEIPGIARAVVAVRKLGREDAICAWYAAREPMDEEKLRSELGRRLTDYMIPAALTWMEAMPLTPNGKVNMKALPEPKPAERKAGRLPETDTEKLLCGIYADILELDTVYADDSFFALGGSSLTVTRVVIAAGKAGKNIAYGDVFAHPTPEALATFLDGDMPKSEFVSLGNYDYHAIDALLKENTLDSFRAGPLRPLGNVLLTGAAGYLAIHILWELLHNYDGKVYCLLRGKGKTSAKARLNGTFYYYFEELLNEQFPDRVEVVEGEVNRPESLEGLKGGKIDTVINCAALVKHFSAGTEIEDVNVGGALNLLAFCKEEGCRFIQTSTMSVGGMYVGKPGPVSVLEETQLYVGQQEGTKYTQSKFLAERAVLQAGAEGMDVKIMRLGTLAPRNRDGEYQINFETNNFMRRLKSAWIAGCYPYESDEAVFELSPIDRVAAAILLLSQTPRENTVFHPFNNNALMMGNLYARMDAIGLRVKGAEASEYQAALEQAQADPEKAEVLTGSIAYQNTAHGAKTWPVGKSNHLTMQILLRMGFRWPVTSDGYMDQFLKALRGLGFFD